MTSFLKAAALVARTADPVPADRRGDVAVHGVLNPGSGRAESPKLIEVTVDDLRQLGIAFACCESRPPTAEEFTALSGGPYPGGGSLPGGAGSRSRQGGHHRGSAEWLRRWSSWRRM